MLAPQGEQKNAAGFVAVSIFVAALTFCIFPTPGLAELLTGGAIICLCLFAGTKG